MAVKMPLGLRIAIIDRAFRRKMDEWAEEIGITAVQLRVLGEVLLIYFFHSIIFHQTDFS